MGWVGILEGAGIPEGVGWVCISPDRGPGIPTHPQVLTPTGGYHKTYGWQKGGMHSTGMLYFCNCLSTCTYLPHTQVNAVRSNRNYTANPLLKNVTLPQIYLYFKSMK